jgi:serine phosphatase RsbU (regulator of sigma subunit)
MEPITTQQVEWAVASCPLDPGESGDAFMVRPLPGATLLSVVDGLGHGPAAAVAARRALDLLSAPDVGDPVATLRRCHEGLKATRGVVLTVAWVDPSSDAMTWLAVGNVQGVLLHVNGDGATTRRPLVGSGGVVGHLLPRLRVTQSAIVPGDVIVLATDGIRADFADHLDPGDSLQQVADTILAGHRTGADDALVLVARYQREIG